MQQRGVQGQLSRTTRLKALIGITMIAAASVVLLGAEGPASAAGTARSVTVQVDGTDSVTVSGRTSKASPRVRFDRRAGSDWVLVKRIRAHAHRYTTTLSVSAGTTRTFRVTSGDGSRRFVVAMPDRKAPTGPTTPPATAKPAPTLYDDCGARPRKADGSAWSCTFHDDFDGNTLDHTKWTPNTYFVSGQTTGTSPRYACYRDDPANVNVKDGVLNLNLLKLDVPATCPLGLPDTDLMAGGVSTYHQFSQQYGRFEARIRTTASDYPGLHEAFWLWPDDRYSPISWPTSGEIDVAETYSSANNLVIPFLHYSAESAGIQYGLNTNLCAADRGVWNTYTLDWGPSRLEVFVNGKSCLVNTSGDPAFQKAYIVNLTQGIGPAPAGNMPVAGTPFPATTQVDYVRVWK